jgi:hypothetical protein
MQQAEQRVTELQGQLATAEQQRDNAQQAARQCEQVLRTGMEAKMLLLHHTLRAQVLQAGAQGGDVPLHAQQQVLQAVQQALQRQRVADEQVCRGIAQSAWDWHAMLCSPR